jgi:hypothetical protein
MWRPRQPWADISKSQIENDCIAEIRPSEMIGTCMDCLIATASAHASTLVLKSVSERNGKVGE